MKQTRHPEIRHLGTLNARLRYVNMAFKFIHEVVNELSIKYLPKSSKSLQPDQSCGYFEAESKDPSLQN